MPPSQTALASALDAWIDGPHRALEPSGEQLGGFGGGADETYRVEIPIDVVDRTAAGFAATRGRVAGFERSMVSAERRLSRLGTGLTRAGTMMTRRFTLPILAAGAASVKVFSDFDDAMTQSLAIMGDVSPKMRSEMERTARDIAKTTTFSAKEAAESYFYLASAGLDAQASIASLEPVAKFAQAGMFDMARATELLTDAQSALGLTIRDDAVKNMENMIRVSDVLVKANTLANASVEEFSESLTNKAAAAARNLDKDVEETVAVLAAFADQGIKGRLAGNALQIVWRDLTTRALKNEEAFREMNVRVFDSEGAMRHTADIVKDLERALDGMSVAQRRATLQQLGFQDRSVAYIQSLIGMGDEIERYDRGLRDAGDTTQEVADKQLESFKNQMRLVFDELKDVAITIGEQLVPHVQRFVRWLGDAAGWFSRLSPAAQSLFLKGALSVAVLGPILKIAGGLARMFAWILRSVLGIRAANVGGALAMGGAGAVRGGAMGAGAMQAGAMGGGMAAGRAAGGFGSRAVVAGSAAAAGGAVARGAGMGAMAMAGLRMAPLVGIGALIVKTIYDEIERGAAQEAEERARGMAGEMLRGRRFREPAVPEDPGRNLLQRATGMSNLSLQELQAAADEWGDYERATELAEQAVRNARSELQQSGRVLTAHGAQILAAHVEAGRFREAMDFLRDATQANNDATRFGEGFLKRWEDAARSAKDETVEAADKTMVWHREINSLPDKKQVDLVLETSEAARVFALFHSQILGASRQVVEGFYGLNMPKPPTPPRTKARDFPHTTRVRGPGRFAFEVGPIEEDVTFAPRGRGRGRGGDRSVTVEVAPGAVVVQAQTVDDSAVEDIAERLASHVAEVVANSE